MEPSSVEKNAKSAVSEEFASLQNSWDWMVTEISHKKAMGSRTGSVRPSVASIHLPPMRACDLNRAMSLRCAIIPICKRTQKRITTKSLPILILHISLLCFLTHTVSADCTSMESSNLLREERGDINPAQSIPIYIPDFNLCGFWWLKSRQVKATARNPKRDKIRYECEFETWRMAGNNQGAFARVRKLAIMRHWSAEREKKKSWP